jgi:gliding motility-associated-like protein
LVLQNNEFDIPNLNNDYDTDGLIDTTSITILNPPINGDATIDYEAGIISYNPEDGFNGLDSIIYSICDNGPIVSCDTAVVYITVTANLPPVALNDTIDAYWGINEPYVISINDYDPEVLLDSVSIEIITLPESGGISIDPETGIVSYMPDYCSTITDSFTYVIYDIQGNVSNIATVLININIDPEGDYDLDGVLDIVEDLNGNGNPCDDDTDGDNKPNFNDTDDDGDSVLTADEDFETPDGDPTNEDTDGDGIPNYLDNNDDGDCQLTIDEDHNQDGNVLNDDIDNDGRPDYLEEDDDNDGILSCDEMGDLDGNGIPDKEEIWNAKTLDDYETIDIDEVLVIDVLSNDSTQMNGSTILIIDEPNHGFVDINDDWTITYTPDLNFIGLDTFVYEVCDYQWHCDTAIVIINVEDLVVLPDLFTPNNDGQNDFYRIKGLYRHPGSTFIVFNRWGNKVYESNDYQQDWDGTSNVSTAVGDKVLPVGVYYCILEYGNGRDKAKAVFLKK